MNEELCRMIRANREAAGLSRIELSRMVGVSNSSVSRWESGKIKNIPHDTAERLCAVLSIDPVLFVARSSEYADIRKETNQEAAERVRKMAERIWNLRIRHDMTRPELARMLGVSSQTVYKWESARIANISPRYLQKMASIFCVRLPFLMGVDDQEGDIDDFRKLILNKPALRELLDLLADDPEDFVQMVSEIIKIMKENGVDKDMEGK